MLRQIDIEKATYVNSSATVTGNAQALTTRSMAFQAQSFGSDRLRISDAHGTTAELLAVRRAEPTSLERVMVWTRVFEDSEGWAVRSAFTINEILFVAGNQHDP